MSAPDTNIEKQEQRHKPSLIGMKGAVVFGALMLLLVVIFSVARGGDTTIGEVYDGDVEQTETTAGFDTYEPGTNQTN